mmetsp:Transcript_20159/g.56165  ORF Transcript_20159/g.56165 Transcript_20159/m.56165 type:complete len:227 (-) Transcript_20159:242-922(-)
MIMQIPKMVRQCLRTCKVQHVQMRMRWCDGRVVRRAEHDGQYGLLHPTKELLGHVIDAEGVFEGEVELVVSHHGLGAIVNAMVVHGIRLVAGDGGLRDATLGGTEDVHRDVLGKFLDVLVPHGCCRAAVANDPGHHLGTPGQVTKGLWLCWENLLDELACIVRNPVGRFGGAAAAYAVVSRIAFDNAALLGSNPTVGTRKIAVRAVSHRPVEEPIVLWPVQTKVNW